MGTESARTKKEKKTFYEAIDKAEGFRCCRYLNEEDGPCCVIGQLAFIEKIPVDTIFSWGNQSISHPSIRCNKLSEKYSIRLLRDIQKIWDGFSMFDIPAASTEKEARAKMKEKVTEYYSVCI